MGARQFLMLLGFPSIVEILKIASSICAGLRQRIDFCCPRATCTYTDIVTPVRLSRKGVDYSLP